VNTTIDINTITRRATVNRDRTPQEAIEATGRVQYINHEVVDSMPRGEGAEVEVVFFKPEEWEYTGPAYMSDDDLEKALERRNLKDDPMAVLAVNEADPTFADDKPHGIHWKDKDSEGKWYCAEFGYWHGERGVSGSCDSCGWSDAWWFPGVPG